MASLGVLGGVGVGSGRGGSVRENHMSPSSRDSGEHVS